MIKNPIIPHQLVFLSGYLIDNAGLLVQKLYVMIVLH